MMSQTARILRSILLVAMAGTLLASTLPCDSICAAITSSQAQDQADASDSHCAKTAMTAKTAKNTPAPPAHSDPPCEDECAGCVTTSVSIPTTGTIASVGAVAGGLLGVTSHAPRFGIGSEARSPYRRDVLEAPPPRDVLALTTILLI